MSYRFENLQTGKLNVRTPSAIWAQGYAGGTHEKLIHIHDGTAFKNVAGSMYPEYDGSNGIKRVRSGGTWPLLDQLQPFYLCGERGGQAAPESTLEVPIMPGPIDFGYDNFIHVLEFAEGGNAFNAPVQVHHKVISGGSWNLCDVVHMGSVQTAGGNHMRSSLWSRGPATNDNRAFRVRSNGGTINPDNFNFAVYSSYPGSKVGVMSHTAHQGIVPTLTYIHGATVAIGQGFKVLETHMSFTDDAANDISALTSDPVNVKSTGLTAVRESRKGTMGWRTWDDFYISADSNWDVARVTPGATTLAYSTYYIAVPTTFPPSVLSPGAPIIAPL